jgi:hypothetical protein
VDAIIEEARLESTGGPAHGEWAVGVGGSIYTEGVITPAGTFGNFAYNWVQNPATTNDWQITDITLNTLDIGVESLA